MDRRAKGTLITIIGIASLAALGAAVGAATQRQGHDPRQLLRRGRRRMEGMTDWQALAGLLERIVDALPRRETDRVLQRLQSRLKNL